MLIMNQHIVLQAWKVTTLTWWNKFDCEDCEERGQATQEEEQDCEERGQATQEEEQDCEERGQATQEEEQDCEERPSDTGRGTRL